MAAAWDCNVSFLLWVPQTQPPAHRLARCAGGLDGLTRDADELRKSVEFATACGAYVTQGPGAIAPQGDEADIEEFLSTVRAYPTPPREYFDIEAKV